MLSIIIPVYRNEDSLKDLLSTLKDSTEKFHKNVEVVFVVDGSPDRSFELLQEELALIAKRRTWEKSKLILLSRNFGSFSAIRTGLAHAEGDYFAVMAADLQEPPELVFQMEKVLKNKEEAVDVVVGTRDGRDDPLMSQLASTIFWGLYRRFIIKEIPPNGVDVFGCNKHFRDILLKLEEQHSSLIAQIFWLGFRRKTISYKRNRRLHGKSAWTLQKKFHYLADSIFAFSDLPIRLLIWFGMVGSIAVGLLGFFIFISKLLGFISVPGYAAIVLVISFVGSINLFGLGVVGSYAWRVYENSKRRPLSIPLNIVAFKNHEL